MDQPSIRFVVQQLHTCHVWGGSNYIRWEDTPSQDSSDLGSAQGVMDHYLADHPKETFRIVKRTYFFKEEVV